MAESTTNEVDVYFDSRTDPKVAEAMEVYALIEELRGEPGTGDSVDIFADAPALEDPHTVALSRDGSHEVYSGTTLLEALRRAAEAKRGGR